MGLERRKHRHGLREPEFGSVRIQSCSGGKSMHLAIGTWADLPKSNVKHVLKCSSSSREEGAGTFGKIEPHLSAGGKFLERWPLIPSASKAAMLSSDPCHPASAAAPFCPILVPCQAAGRSTSTFASKNRFYPVFTRVSRFTVNRSWFILSSGEDVAWKSMHTVRKGCLVGRVVSIKSIFK